MQKHDEKDWESLLKTGLDQVSDLGDEEPPNLASLQMLVSDVQAEQRRSLYADLLRFWAVAAVLLSALAWVWLRQPVFILALQGSVALLSLVGAGLWYLGGRRAAE